MTRISSINPALWMRTPRTSFLPRLATALACLLPLSAVAPVAGARSNSVNESLRGTLCDAPQDQNTKNACAMALVQCTLTATMHGRSEEESGRILKVCVQKTASTAKRQMDAQGDAVRRAYGGETDAQVAADLAAKKRALEKADADAAAERDKSYRAYQLAEQQRVEAVKRACTTGVGTLVPTSMIRVQVPHSVLAIYVNHQNYLTPVADPQAVSTGNCSVQIVYGRRSFVAQISMRDVTIAGLTP